MNIFHLDSEEFVSIVAEVLLRDSNSLNRDGSLRQLHPEDVAYRLAAVSTVVGDTLAVLNERGMLK